MNRIAALIGLTLCIVVTGCSAADDSPTAAYLKLNEYAAGGEWGSFHDRLTDQSREFVSSLVSRSFPDGETTETPQSRQAFVDLMSGADAESYKWLSQMLAGKVLEERPDGDGAVLIVDIDGRKNALVMVQREDTWRLDRFFDLWQAKALQSGTTPDLEQKLFQCGTFLSTARGVVAQSRRQTGTVPTELGFANPLSPEAVAKQIVVTDQPGADGTTVEPSRAGWVWNSADEALHAAGYDEKTIKREKWDRSLPENKHRAFRNLEWVARGRVGRAEPSEEDVQLQQWDAFETKTPLRNPASPDDVATRITTTVNPGENGTSVSPSAAGWVWNTADRRLYVAGYAGHPSE